MTVQHAFLGMVVASSVHVVEEYVYPGGFLKWLRLLLPGEGITPFEAVIINAVFLGFVVSPFFHPAENTPVISLSIASLLLANGALHVAGSFLTHRYSPGAITSVLAYFPSAIYALLVIPGQWKMSSGQVVSGCLLGVAWQATPLVIAFWPHFRGRKS